MRIKSDNKVTIKKPNNRNCPRDLIKRIDDRQLQFMHTGSKTQNIEIHQNSVSFKFRNSRKSYSAKGRMI